MTIHEPYEPFYEKDPLNPETPYYPEGLGQQYPYGFSTGAEPCQPIVLFFGCEYAVTPSGLVVAVDPYVVGIGADGQYIIAFGFSFKSIGKFVSNAVKTAGREIGHAAKSVQSAVGAVTKEIGKIPVVGGPLTTVFDAAYHSSFAMVHATVAVAKGQRIDRALMDQVKIAVKDVKQVGPYAQMVVSMVPGVGQGISAGISAGVALANGQPIAECLKAGALGAMPGGPLVQSAVKASIDTVTHIAKGGKLNLAKLADTAGGLAAGALNLPPAAKGALMAGLATTGNIVQGQPLDKALADAAVHALPVPDATKKAVTEATALTLDLAHGKPLDRAFMARIDGVVGMLPTNAPLRQNLLNGTKAVREIGQGKNAQQVMMAAIQSGVGDQLVSLGAATLPQATKNGIKTGIALGTGLVHQGRTAVQLTKAIPGKLVESGIQLGKTSPIFGEARKIATSKGGSRGFDIATGILSHQAGIFHLSTVRNSLTSPSDKMGFDMAMATRIGAVSHPKPTNIKSPAAHAGLAMTLGMQTYVPERKVAMMATIQGNPGAAAGATEAVKQVAAKREGIIQRILRALHLRK
ncbi:MAG TPA: hypothetical protein VF077_09690 [Nitrospiraceae bacterium]